MPAEGPTSVSTKHLQNTVSSLSLHHHCTWHESQQIWSAVVYLLIFPTVKLRSLYHVLLKTVACDAYTVWRQWRAVQCSPLRHLSPGRWHLLYIISGNETKGNAQRQKHHRLISQQKLQQHKVMLPQLGTMPLQSPQWHKRLGVTKRLHGHAQQHNDGPMLAAAPVTTGKTCWWTLITEAFYRRWLSLSA